FVFSIPVMCAIVLVRWSQPKLDECGLCRSELYDELPKQLGFVHSRKCAVGISVCVIGTETSIRLIDVVSVGVSCMMGYRNKLVLIPVTCCSCQVCVIATETTSA